MPTISSGSALVQTTAAIPTGSDGAVHLYVDPATGSDTSGNGSSTARLASIGRALSRLNDWLDLYLDVDVVIELANGTYDPVDLALPRVPRRRIIFRGDYTTMEVIASGTATGGSASTVVDAAASFATEEHVTLFVAVWNPTSGPATFAGNSTFQIASVRSHTGTTINPTVAFNPAPAAGWRYEIRKPLVVLRNVPTASGYRLGRPTVNVVCPFPSMVSGSLPEPQVVFAFLRVSHTPDGSGFDQPVYQFGGSVLYTTVLVETSTFEGFGVYGAGLAQSGLVQPLVADPIFGLGASDARLTAGLAVKTTSGGNAMRAQESGVLYGSPVVKGGSIFITDQGEVSGIIGGAIYDGSLEVNFDSATGHVGDGFDANLPFLIKRTQAGAAAVRSGRHCGVLIDAIEFASLTGNAVQVDSVGFFDITAAPLGGSDATRIGGSCIRVQDGGQARVRTTITNANWDSTAARMSADTAQTLDDWTAGPLVGTVSGARVWRD